MYKLVSQLLMYGDLKEDEILREMGEIFARYNSGEYKESENSKIALIRDINVQIKNILKVATDYGFDENLWHNYLTFFLITSENPFSLTCEKVGASEGSVNRLVENDFKVMRELFNFDFSPIESDLGIDCFSMISDYRAIVKKDLMYNKNVSEKVRVLSRKLENTADSKEFFDAVTQFYHDFGVGMFGLNKAFRIEERNDTDVRLVAINNMDNVVLDDLVGYEIQKKKLIDNTEAFVNGKGANNALLFGDSGTGKSTSIKAIENQYYPDGLRMIEIYKHQFKYLSKVIAMIKNRNYKFIIYMDDLSFEEHEIEYKFLKAVIEGGVETRPDNILIYATSNRRHLIKETWNDRNDMDNTDDRHHSDTVEEKLSLANRFGCQISFSKPSFNEFYNMVIELARRQNIDMPESELKAEANKWELSHGGISGRTAQQFVNYLKGIK